MVSTPIYTRVEAIGLEFLQSGGEGDFYDYVDFGILF